MMIHPPPFVRPAEGTAYLLRYLLSNPPFASRLGQFGHEHVREHLLITSALGRYMTLFLHSMVRG
jgi:hypothetical protein